MRRRTGQVIVLLSAGTLIVASALPWADWVWRRGVLERSHRGISFSIASIPTFATMIAAGLLLVAAVIGLRRTSLSTQLGLGVTEFVLSAIAVIPAVLVMTRLSDAAYFRPSADAGIGLWLAIGACAAAAIGAVLVTGMAVSARSRKLPPIKRAEPEEVRRAA